MKIFISSLGTIWPKWILKPCAKARYAPFFIYGAIDVSYILPCCSSGTSIIMISAAFAASSVDITVRPAFFAFSADLLPSFNPIITSIPLSLRLLEWAKPCEPYPITAIFFPFSNFVSASLS